MDQVKKISAGWDERKWLMIVSAVVGVLSAPAVGTSWARLDWFERVVLLGISLGALLLAVRVWVDRRENP